VIALIFHYIKNGEIPYPAYFSKYYLLGCGALFVIYTGVLYLAIDNANTRSQVLEIGLINYLWPILTVLFSIPLLGNRMGILLLPGIILTMIGIFLVASQGQEPSLMGFLKNLTNNPIAYGLALVAALSWGLYSNLSRLWGAKDKQGAVTLFMLSTGGLLIVFRLFVVEHSQWSILTLLELLFMSVASWLGYVFWDIAVRKGNFVVVSISSYFTPLLSTIIACLYLDIIAGINLWIGCSLIIIGAYLSKLGVQERGQFAT
jgi:drug/metabolite transporter (DMT)-like permease